MMLGNPSEILGNEGVVCMIREERLLGAFRELVSIDNPTLRERCLLYTSDAADE